MSRAQKYFGEWVKNNNLMDIRINNGTFIWNNRRLGFGHIAEKLDRFFFRGDLTKFWNTLSSSILTTIGSNHFPVTLEVEEEKKPSKCIFKFEKMWFLKTS